MIIDDKYAIHGSLNFGQKSLKNYEHFTITQDQNVIEKFNQRFRQLWDNVDRFSDYINYKSDSEQG